MEDCNWTHVKYMPNHFVHSRRSLLIHWRFLLPTCPFLLNSTTQRPSTNATTPYFKGLGLLRNTKTSLRKFLFLRKLPRRDLHSKNTALDETTAHERGKWSTVYHRAGSVKSSPQLHMTMFPRPRPVRKILNRAVFTGP